VVLYRSLSFAIFWQAFFFKSVYFWSFSLTILWRLWLLLLFLLLLSSSSSPCSVFYVLVFLDRSVWCNVDSLITNKEHREQHRAKNRLEGKGKGGIEYTDNINKSADLELELHTANNRYVLEACIQAILLINPQRMEWSRSGHGISRVLVTCSASASWITSRGCVLV
jgi:hypothetical protein